MLQTVQIKILRCVFDTFLIEMTLQHELIKMLSFESKWKCDSIYLTNELYFT